MDRFGLDVMVCIIFVCHDDDDDVVDDDDDDDDNGGFSPSPFSVLSNCGGNDRKDVEEVKDNLSIKASSEYNDSNDDDDDDDEVDDVVVFVFIDLSLNLSLNLPLLLVHGLRGCRFDVVNAEQ